MWDGKGAWHFVSLPKETYDDLKSISSGSVGFGSLRVHATIGNTSWDTSIFADSKRKTFLLPIKKSVRDIEGLDTGDSCKCQLVISF